MRNCPNCGTQTRQAARFCSNCGEPLQQSNTPPVYPQAQREYRGTPQQPVGAPTSTNAKRRSKAKLLAESRFGRIILALIMLIIAFLFQSNLDLPGNGIQNSLPGRLTFEDSFSIVNFQVANRLVAFKIKGKEAYSAKNGETIFTLPPGNIMITSANGKDVRTFIEWLDGTLTPTDLTLSEDGLLVAYYGYCKEYDDYGLVIRERSTTELLAFYDDMFPEEWTPDNRLLVLSVAGNTSEVYITRPEDWDNLEQLSVPPDILHPTISPNGTRIAFVRNNHIWVMNIGGTNSIQVTNSNNNESYPTWSPDGKYLLVLAQDTADDYGVIYLISPDKLHQIPDDALRGRSTAPKCSASTQLPCSLADNDGNPMIARPVSWR